MLVLLFLLVVVDSPASPSGAPSSSRAIPYSAARALADSPGLSYQGGPWVAILAVGLDSPNFLTMPLNSSLLSGTRCPFEPAPGGSSLLSVPAYSGNVSAGLAPAWEVVYRNAAGDAAIVSVTSSQASVLGTFASNQCGALFGIFPPLPSDAVNSTVAGRAVSPFVRNFTAEYAALSAVYALGGTPALPGASPRAFWAISFTTCSVLASPGSTGALFNATVDAATGRVTSAQTRLGVPCGIPTTPYSLGAALVPSPATLNGTLHVDSSVVADASDGITGANPSVEVVSRTTGMPETGGHVSAETSRLAIITTYDPLTFSPLGGSTTPNAMGDQLVVASRANLSGDFLLLAGVGSFGGTGNLGL